MLRKVWESRAATWAAVAVCLLLGFAGCGGCNGCHRDAPEKIEIEDDGTPNWEWDSDPPEPPAYYQPSAPLQV